MDSDFRSDIEKIARIPDIPSILEVICQMTGLRFAAVARVTKERWVACIVRDEINIGLQPGSELKVDTTICHEIRESHEPVIIDHVAADDVWSKHPTPALYGFQSYIAVPIMLEDGSLFGTLCALDPKPTRLSTPAILGMLQFFARLIGRSLDSDHKLEISNDTV